MKNFPDPSADMEGVIQFELAYKKSKPVAAALVHDMNPWRHRLKKVGWMGQDPDRYHGLGFGNISQKISAKQFIVTGTQTGHKQHLTNRDFSVVRKCDPMRNVVIATGPVAPSSESMTHAMIYALDPTARYVIHVHAPLLWNNRVLLELPTTSQEAPYGTPEMAREVKKLYRQGSLRSKKIFAMAGHLDGVISYGKTIDEAGSRLLLYGLIAQCQNNISPRKKPPTTKKGSSTHPL